MSAKFKPGDMVELLVTNEVWRNHPGGCAQRGMIGTVEYYIGNKTIKQYNYSTENAWSVKFPTLKESWACSEFILRLIPGGNEYKNIGKWDEIPFVGKLFEKSKEKKPEPVTNLENPF